MNFRITWMATAPLLAFVVAPAQSATFCVNPSAASCSATIQGAVDAAAAGDTVSIASGFYNENVTVPVTLDGLTIRGSKSAVLDGDAPLSGVALIVNAPNVSVQGFTIRNGEDTGIEMNGAGGSVQRMLITGTDSDCIDINSDNVLVRGNRLRGCGDNSIDVNGNNVDIVGNTISQCDNSCLDISGNGFIVEKNKINITEDSYLIDFSGDDGEIVNNKLANADSEAISGSGDNTLVSGNKIANTYAMIDVSGANPAVTRNRGRYVGGAGDGIDISCSVDCTTALVSNNRIEDVRDDTTGLTVSASAAGMIVENNSIRRVEDIGLDLSGTASVTVRKNSVMTNGGDDGTPCYDVNGLGAHVVENNRGADCHGDGINVAGTGHMIDGNAVRDLLEDGVDVGGATNVVVIDNSIRDAHGVGLEVENSTGTSVDGNSVNGARVGICDEATGTTLGTNTTKNVALANQLNTASACPID